MATTHTDVAHEVTVPAGPAEGPEHEKHHRGRRILTVVGVVVVALVLVAVWFVYGGERPQQTSEEQARQRVAAPSSTSSTVAGAAPFAAPPQPGLYRYQGSGRENTTFPPLVEQQGPSMPATVNQTSDGCWTFQIDYNTHHWQNWTYCTRDGELREQKNTSFARRSFGSTDIDNTSEFTCEPTVLIVRPTDPPGTTRDRSCVGHGNVLPAETTAQGTITVVGPDQLDVAGQPIPTMHVRYDLTYTGGQSGTETTDLWFASSTGLPVKNEHHIKVNTDTPIGNITYTEDAQFVLQSLSPV